MPLITGRVRRGAAAVLALLVVGCTGGQDPEPTSSPTPTVTVDDEPAVAPVLAEMLVDGAPVELEVGPLAVHDDAAVLRLAAPVAESVLLPAFWYVFGDIGRSGPNGVRLVDLEAGTVAHVVRTSEDGSVTSGVFSPGGPATDAALAAAGEGVQVVYAAFGVPDADTVDVLLPDVGWVRDVPVVPAADAGVLTVPPSELVKNPVGDAQVLALEEFRETHDGNVRSRETTEQVAVTVSADVLFAFDSDQLAPDADAALRTAAEQIAAHGAGTLTVVGHTDDQGEEAYNVDLSQRRAQTVATRLAALVDLGRFDVTVEGRGESEPVVSGTGEAERALNRRVELVLVPQAGAPAGGVPDAGTPGPSVAELPEIPGPVAPGATGVSVVDGDDTFDVRLPEVHRVGRYLVGRLEVTNTGDSDLSLSSLAVGAWDSRGAFDPRLQTAPTNVSLVSGTTRWYPVDYVTDPESGRRSPLADRIVDGIAPGEVRPVTVVWPDPGTSTVTVDVAPRFSRTVSNAQIAGHAPFRLTDVPVVTD